MTNTRVQLAAAVAQAERNAPMRAWAPFPHPIRGRPDRRPAGRRVVAQRARRTATRSASRGDPDLADPEPPGWPDAPASPFQTAHRALLPLTRTELRAVIDIAQRRLDLLEVAA